MRHAGARESPNVWSRRVFLWIIIRVHAPTCRLLFAMRTYLPPKSRPPSSIRMKGIHPNTCARTLPDTSTAPYTTNYAQSTSRVNLPMSETTHRRALREIESPNYNVAESLRSSDVDFRVKDTRCQSKVPRLPGSTKISKRCPISDPRDTISVPPLRPKFDERPVVSSQPQHHNLRRPARMGIRSK